MIKVFPCFPATLRYLVPKNACFFAFDFHYRGLQEDYIEMKHALGSFKKVGKERIIHLWRRHPEKDVLYVNFFFLFCQ